MALPAGTRLGPYEIQSAIGAGGMGEVYRALDTTLHRDVAIKILPSAVAADKDRLARFRREAQVLASLNHPNIAAIYGFEESTPATGSGQAVQALVLELVAGPTLADRIGQGPIPLDDALAIGRQITEAVNAAHDQGIVHRDLKPANIKIRPDGTVKVLDFGLAKALDSGPSVMNQSTSPTMTTPAMTQMGVILGTAAYMSPEQAKGRAADKRSDVWAFGCVLFEMLTGDQLFRGETITDVLAAIVKDQPDLSRVPPQARRLVQSCLEKDPKRRLQSVGDAWLLLDDRAELIWPTRRHRWVPWAAALAVALGVAAAWVSLARQPARDTRALTFHVNPPPGTTFQTNLGGASISPDGRTIAFVAAPSSGVSSLWARALDSVSARQLPGTDGAAYPFWAPDGRSLGFFAGGRLWRIELSGGFPIDLAAAPIPRGGAWSSNGTIVFQPMSVGALQRINQSGGTAVPLTSIDLANGENAHRWPQFLPDGQQFLFHSRSSHANRTGTYLASLDRPQEKTLVLQSVNSSVYSPPHGNAPGFLLWLRESNLIAQPFAAERAQLSGEPTIITAAGVVGSLAALNRSSFSVSNEGTVMASGTGDLYDLTWFTRDGKVASTVGKTDRYAAVRLSPDGARVAVSIVDGSGNRDLWGMDLPRGLPNRLTLDGGFVPIWSPDGSRIAYHSAGQNQLFMLNSRVDKHPGDGGRRTLLESESQDLTYVNDWSPDGQFLMITRISAATSYDLWLVPAGGGKLEPFLNSRFGETHGQFSPDGKWIAYTSNESGQNEIYVQTMPASQSRRVSTGGGGFPRWRKGKDGTELFYRAADGRLMAVSVRLVSQGLEFGDPTALSRIVEPLGAFAYPYDVSPDGQRILALTPSGGEQDARPLTVLVNFVAGLKK